MLDEDRPTDQTPPPEPAGTQPPWPREPTRDDEATVLPETAGAPAEDPHDATTVSAEPGASRAAASAGDATTADDGPGTARDAPVVRAAPPGTPVEPEDPERIGPFRIERRLGEGGFGVVYLAEQREPIRRRVALKLVKAGMGSRQVLARFAAERQTLALMSHPGLAKVIDAGTSEGGQPYFVMEFVDGRPIVRACDVLATSIDDRLLLFTGVCEAMQHAHGKGIIHRDLKPGNILLQVDGESLLPRVIDFGIAKALDPEAIGSTSVTVEGQFMGTPEYMAPEQTGFTGLDVDARADVYSLGVILFELLTGTLPFPTHEIAEAREREGLVGIQKLLCEQAAPRPSAAFARLAREDPSEAAAIARTRGTTVRDLERRLRGDLDWIVLRCLEKEPDRRYATPLEIGAELRRTLAHEPVDAGPPSRAYRARKFVRRNAGVVASLVAVFVLLVAGVATTSWLLVQVALAEREAAGTIDFVERSIVNVDPSLGGPSMRAIDLFRSSASQIETSLPEQPRVRLRLYELFASVSLALNEYVDAERFASSGLELLDRLGVGDVERRLDLSKVLADARFAQGLDPGSAIADATPMRGDAPEEHATEAFARHNLGDEIGAAWHYGLEQDVLALDGPSFALATSFDYLGRLCIDIGFNDEGERLLSRAAEMRDELSDRPGQALAFSRLSRGYAWHAAGEFDRALLSYGGARDLYAELLDDEGRFMVQLCDLEIAGLVEDANDARRDLGIVAPPIGDDVAFMEGVLLRNRGRLLARLGFADAARERFDRSIATDESLERDDARAHTLRVRAEFELAEGAAEAAERLVRESIEILRSSDARGSRGALAMALTSYAEILVALSRFEEAAAAAATARAIRIESVDPGGWPIRAAEGLLTAVGAARGDASLAVRTRSIAAELDDPAFGPVARREAARIRRVAATD